MERPSLGNYYNKMASWRNRDKMIACTITLFTHLGNALCSIFHPCSYILEFELWLRAPKEDIRGNLNQKQTARRQKVQSDFSFGAEF